MQLTIIETTEEQRQAAMTAGQQRYNYNLNTPNRPGWKGGKCPVGEYLAIMGEIGSANALNYDWHQLCLFSTDPADFRKPDMGVWEVKIGNSFTNKDFRKGARYIIWANPLVKQTGFYCRIPTCEEKYHQFYDSKVEIRGWTDLSNPAEYSDFGDYFKPSDMHNASTLPYIDWGVAA